MERPKNILAISGSTRNNSVNELILRWMAGRHQGKLNITIYNRIAELPHFRSDWIDNQVPQPVEELYSLIAQADGVIICTPEYVFSLPGAIKNALEWTVSTMLLTDKPVALIVASSLGEKAFESLLLIMQTLGARFNQESTLLISGVKSKISINGEVEDKALIAQLDVLVDNLISNIVQTV